MSSATLRVQPPATIQDPLQGSRPSLSAHGHWPRSFGPSQTPTSSWPSSPQITTVLAATGSFFLLRAPVVLGLVLLAVAAACGDDDDKAASPTAYLVQVIDRLFDVTLHVLGVGRQPIGAVLEVQANSVDRLDHSIMQVHPNSVSLLQACQALESGVEPRVGDSDRRLGCEKADELLVSLVEAAVTLLLRQVENCR